MYRCPRTWCGCSCHASGWPACRPSKLLSAGPCVDPSAAAYVGAGGECGADVNISASVGSQTTDDGAFAIISTGASGTSAAQSANLPRRGDGRIRQWVDAAVVTDIVAEGRCVNAAKVPDRACRRVRRERRPGAEAPGFSCRSS